MIRWSIRSIADSVSNAEFINDFGHTMHTEIGYIDKASYNSCDQELITQEWTAFLAQKSPKMLIFKAM